VVAGSLAFIAMSGYGIVFSNKMIRIGLLEEKWQKMAQAGLLEKPKWDRLSVSDDGALLEYEELPEQLRVQS